MKDLYIWNPQQCEKNWKSAFENNFFQGNKLFFKNFYFNNWCKNEYNYNNEKICSQFGILISKTQSILICTETNRQRGS